MGRKAEKNRKQAAKVKKRSEGQNSSAPSVVPTAPLTIQPPSPPPSPHTEADTIPKADGGMDANALKAVDKKPTTKERKARRVPTSDRVTRFRGVAAGGSSNSVGGSDVTGETSQVEVAPKLFQLHKSSHSEGDGGPNEQRPVRQSSVAIRALLQRISSETNMEEDSAVISSGEDGGESSNDDSEANEEKKSESNNDSDDEAVEVVVLKKVAPSKGPRKR